MRKTNHQKHGFHPRSKEDRRRKDFVLCRKWIREEERNARWNGRSRSSLFSGEVGQIESIRIIEI